MKPDSKIESAGILAESFRQLVDFLCHDTTAVAGELDHSDSVVGLFVRNTSNCNCLSRMCGVELKEGVVRCENAVDEPQEITTLVPTLLVLTIAVSNGFN